MQTPTPTALELDMDEFLDTLVMERPAPDTLPGIPIAVPSGEEQRQARTAELARQHALWALVCPSRRGESWKARVDQRVTEVELVALGASIADVVGAVEFMTATTARASRVHGEPAWLIRAPGYWRGPAA